MDAAFYNQYSLLNEITHYRFSDKFKLCVLDLSRLDTVPVEERNTPLYRWASVFQANTWKELLKMAEESTSIKKAVVTLHQLTAEEEIRLQCESRERYWMDWQSSLRTSRQEGIDEGIFQERANTEREKQRADAAERRASALEAELEKYRKLFGSFSTHPSF